VILLPMLLDNEPAVPTQDIELQIPDKDKAGEFVPKMVLPPTGAVSAVQTATSAPVIAPLLDVKPPSPVIPPKVQAQAADKAKPKAEPKTTAKPADKPASRQYSGFVVQVGAFANADAAKKLQEVLHKQGYSSYTEKVGNKTRVRIGGYATHAEAEKVQRKLEIQGMKPDVVNLN
jgi:DedD protein